MRAKKKAIDIRTLFRLNSTGAPLHRREDNPWCERLSQSFALFILTLFPLLLSHDYYSKLTLFKFRLFTISTVVYFILCLLILIFHPGSQNRGLKRNPAKPRMTVPQIILLAYVLWAAISMWHSSYSGLWLGQRRYEGLLSILLYATVFLLLSTWGEYTDAYTYGLGLMGTAVGFIAMLQTFGALIFYPIGFDYWNSSFLTTIGHEDCVACLINILIPTLLSGFVILKSPWRWLGVPALFLMAYLTVYTDVDTAKLGIVTTVLLLPCLIESRERFQETLVALIPILLGAALGFSYHRDRSFEPGALALAFLLAAAALGIAAWAMSKRKQTWSVAPAVIRRSAYAVLAVLLIVALVALYGYQGDNRLVREFSELLHGNLRDEAGSFRGYIWKCTWKIIGEHPVFGGGPGSFASLFEPYNPGYQALLHDEIIVDFPHNDFLSVAACTGLVGLALYLAFLIALAVRCIRAAFRCPVLLIFLGGMAGYLIYSFFVFSIAVVSPLFWVLAGLADKCVRQLE